MFQDLPSRIDRRLDGPREAMRRKRLRHLHPMMLHEMMMMTSEKSDGPVGLLVLAGLIREDLPWIYELLMEGYRCLRAGDPEGFRRVIRGVHALTELLHQGPFSEEIGLDPEMAGRFVMEIPMLLEHYGERFVGRARKPRAANKTSGS